MILDLSEELSLAEARAEKAESERDTAREELADYVSRQPSAHAQRIREAEGAVTLEKARTADAVESMKLASEKLFALQAKVTRAVAIGESPGDWDDIGPRILKALR